jgi:hypothetical protein
MGFDFDGLLSDCARITAKYLLIGLIGVGAAVVAGMVLL